MAPVVAMSAARAGALEISALIARLVPTPPSSEVRPPTPQSSSPPAEGHVCDEHAEASVRVRRQHPRLLAVGATCGARGRRSMTPKGSLPTVEEDAEAESDCSTADSADIPGDADVDADGARPVSSAASAGTSSAEVTPAPTPAGAAAGTLTAGGLPKTPGGGRVLCLSEALIADTVVGDTECVAQPDSSAPVLPQPQLPQAVAAPGEVGATMLPSIGSLGHGSGRCKPCAFVGKDGCRSGAECLFCHLCDPGEKKRRKKQLKATRSAIASAAAASLCGQQAMFLQQGVLQPQFVQVATPALAPHPQPQLVFLAAR